MTVTSISDEVTEELMHELLGLEQFANQWQAFDGSAAGGRTTMRSTVGMEARQVSR